jgi:hypothetical protein
MTKDEALRLALEALEDLGYHHHDCPQWPTFVEPDNYPKCNCGYDQAITAIKAALEAKDEPVACIEYIPCCTDQTCSKCKATTPPQRKPLTDEEIDKAMAENKQTLIDATDNYWNMRRAYARIIEAAHGIKELP